jgi:hypothetical protein
MKLKHIRNVRLMPLNITAFGVSNHHEGGKHNVHEAVMSAFDRQGHRLEIDGHIHCLMFELKTLRTLVLIKAANRADRTDKQS